MGLGWQEIIFFVFIMGVLGVFLVSFAVLIVFIVKMTNRKG